MKSKVKTSVIIKKSAVMLGLFLLADIVLYLIFGSYLDGRAFTGIQRAGAYMTSLGETPPADYSQPIRLFQRADYFRNCTVWCLVEDVGISLAFFVYLFLLKQKRNIEGGMETSAFWLTHVCVKTLLNLNSTVMMMGVMEYSRETVWRTYGPDNPMFDWKLQLPADCFYDQKKSLLLGLGVSGAVFAAILLASLLIPVGSRIKKAPAANKRHAQKKTDEKAAVKNLYWRYACWGVRLIAVITVLWSVLVFAVLHVENKNMIKIFQYSAIMKLLLPVCLTVNESVFRLERSDPEKYVQNHPARYTCNSLIMIMIVCLALVMYSEFGSIISILILSVYIFLAFTAIPDNAQATIRTGIWKEIWKRKWKVVMTILIGLIGGLGIAFAENTLFQKLAGECEINLTGRFLGIPMESTGAQVLGWLFLGLFAVALLACLVCAFRWGRTAFIFGGCTAAALALYFFNGLEPEQNGIVKKLHELAADIPPKLLTAVLIVPLALCVISVAFWVLQRGMQNDSKKLSDLPVPKKCAWMIGKLSVSWRILILILIGCTIVFNTKCTGYNGNTLLREFYFQAGNFNGEYEITPDITDKRKKEVSRYWGADSLTEEQQEQWEKIQSQYNVEVYHNSITRRVMRLIDRLCFSTKTNELKKVLNGLRSNMGFAPTENSTYISSLQERTYLIRKTLESADEETKALYRTADGSYRDGYYEVKVRDKNGNIIPWDKDEKREVANQRLILFEHYITKEDMNRDPALQDRFCKPGTDEDALVLKEGYRFGEKNGKEYLMYADSEGREEERVSLEETEEEKKILCRCNPETAYSDYALFTLSKMGVGNTLLLIFIPFFTLLCIVNLSPLPVRRMPDNALTAFLFWCQHVSRFLVVSFIIQTAVIVCGVFGKSLFSGLSLPLVAKGNCEMLINGCCVGFIMACIVIVPDILMGTDRKIK